MYWIVNLSPHPEQKKETLEEVSPASTESLSPASCSRFADTTAQTIIPTIARIKIGIKTGRAQQAKAKTTIETNSPGERLGCRFFAFRRFRPPTLLVNEMPVPGIDARTWTPLRLLNDIPPPRFPKLTPELFFPILIFVPGATFLIYENELPYWSSLSVPPPRNPEAVAFTF